MDPYDHRVVAGLGNYTFSKTLLELSDFVGIPPPEFRGRRKMAWRSGRYKPLSKDVKRTLKTQLWTTPTHTLI
jgi:hypothetical protein